MRKFFEAAAVKLIGVVVSAIFIFAIFLFTVVLPGFALYLAWQWVQPHTFGGFVWLIVVWGWLLFFLESAVGIVFFVCLHIFSYVFSSSAKATRPAASPQPRPYDDDELHVDEDLGPG